MIKDTWKVWSKYLEGYLPTNNLLFHVDNKNQNVKLFWIYLFLSTLGFVLQWLCLHWEILIILLSQFPLTFHHIQNGMPHFIPLLMTILMLIVMVFLIIWEIFYGRMSLNSVLLLLLVNFVSGSGWNDVYIPHRIRSSLRWSLTHLHGFQLLACHSS